MGSLACLARVGHLRIGMGAYSESLVMTVLAVCYISKIAFVTGVVGGCGRMSRGQADAGDFSRRMRLESVARGRTRLREGRVQSPTSLVGRARQRATRQQKYVDI